MQRLQNSTKSLNKLFKKLYKTQEQLQILHSSWFWPFFEDLHFGITNLQLFWSDVKAYKGGGSSQDAPLLQLAVTFVLIQV